jgi:adenylate cyclase
MLPRLNPRHRILTAICVSLTALVALLYGSGSYLSAWEQEVRDWLTTNKRAQFADPDPRIVFLMIDEHARTLDTLWPEDLQESAALRLMKEKPYPWKRQVYGLIVDRLLAAGARAVVFDIVFPQKESEGEGSQGDDAFRAVLDRNPGKVVLGSNLVHGQQTDVGDSRTSLTPQHILPSPKLRPSPGQPSWLGFVSFRPDSDNLVRRSYYRTTFEEYFGIPPSENSKEIYSVAARTLEDIGMADKIPKTRQAVLFRFCEDFLPRSLQEIFVETQWNAPPYNGGELFRDKIVLIGASPESSEDRLQTPFGTTSGPFVQLSALNAALHGDFLVTTTPAQDFAIIAFAGLIAWALGGWVRRPILRLFLIAVMIFGMWFAAQNLANMKGFIPILLSPVLALASCGVTWSAWEQVLDRIERQRTRRALERYVGQDVAGEVLDNPASYLDTLGGKRKEVTILFSDIRGFTTLTESADAHQLVTQLNEYFTEMVAIVFAQQGTLDKFIGDAVMAHWGGIVSAGPETDAVRAVTTALEMCEALKKLNADWKTRGITEWAIGIGLNHGAPITGNIGASGTRERFDFTVVGDAVNLASRLEGTTKNYHIELCIGESVAALVRNQFPLRSVDLIIVKGKTKPVEIFTVLGKQGAPAPSWLPVHDEAMRCYRAGEFAAAEAAWRQVLEQVPGDGLTETMLARCVELQITPPPAPWTGVYEMKSK